MTVNLQQPDARTVLSWAYETYGDRAAISTAFGPSGVALMHLASQINPGARVFFIDTGFHFPETLAMVDRIQARLDVQVEVIEPLISVAEQALEYGDELPVLDSNQCCSIRKVEPNKRLLRGLGAWITALRRDQGPSRANTPVLEIKQVDGRHLAKLNPLVTWKRQEVWQHIFAHDLPYNPLHDDGYPSVGCWPCTRRATDPDDERSGRWAGQNKTECGLHTAI